MILLAGLPQSGKLPVLFLLRGQKKQHFHPFGATRCTDSCEIWHSRGARGSALDRAKFHANRCRERGPQKWKMSTFGKESPHRGESVTEGTWVRLDVQNFTSVGAGGGNAPPKYEKFPLFGKESPRGNEPFDRFLEFLWTFIRPTILH